MSTKEQNAPVFFIDGEELAQYAQSCTGATTGVAYEWEYENVIHIRFNPLRHAFGKPHNVVFSRNKAERKGDDLLVIVDENGNAEVHAPWLTAPVTPQIIPSKADLYSRNKGILELNILESKRVVIIGLGSFGSQISIELAKAGVGHFVLMDFDRVELHNLARHTATTNDLGRLKTDVLADAIKGKNPYATVDKYPININEHIELLTDEVAKADVVICATDNNLSRFNINKALVKYGKTGIFGRAITRAEGGDVFIYRKGGPCYCCLLGNDWFDATMEEITNEQSARNDGRIAAYTSAEDADAMVQVGLSADIEPMCNMMVKLALTELSRGAQSGITSLEQELVYPYYMWANRRERNYSNWGSFDNAEQLPTIMRWYGVDIERDAHCAQCGETISLDTGEKFLQQFGDEAGGIKTDTSIDLDKL